MPTANPNALAAGTLNKVVTIQQVSTTKDPFGQSLTTWVPVLTTRAAITTVTASEKFAPNQFTTQISHTVTIRYPGDEVRITTGMRVIYRNHVYRIQFPENVEAGNRVLKLLCQELNGDE